MITMEQFADGIDVEPDEVTEASSSDDWLTMRLRLDNNASVVAQLPRYGSGGMLKAGPPTVTADYPEGVLLESAVVVELRLRGLAGDDALSVMRAAIEFARYLPKFEVVTK